MEHHSNYDDYNINREGEEIYSNINEEQQEEIYESGEEQEKNYDSSINEKETTNHTQEPGESQEGRFSFSEIQNYLSAQKYPLGFSKADKLALRKRVKFFKVDNGHLYYTGKGEF